MASEERIIRELMAAGYTQARALALIGLPKSSWYYRHHPRPRVAHDRRCSPKQLAPAQRERIVDLLEDEDNTGKSVWRIYFDHLDSPDPLLGSLRTFYRIKASLRSGPHKQRRSSPTRNKPMISATGPGQVLCWDITWLPASFMSKGYHLYTVLDLYSRKIVGYTIQLREDKYIAKNLIKAVIANQALHGHKVSIVHTDNGSVMTSTTMRKMLTDRSVELSLIRPGVSNDNPFIESSHGTIKHHRFALEYYPTLAIADQVISRIITAYNHHDHHSGLNGFTPEQVYTGQWATILAHRKNKENQYYTHFPNRRPKQSMHKPPPEIVAINTGTTNQHLQLEEPTP